MVSARAVSRISVESTQPNMISLFEEIRSNSSVIESILVGASHAQLVFSNLLKDHRYFVYVPIHLGRDIFHFFFFLFS